MKHMVCRYSMLLLVITAFSVTSTLSHGAGKTPSFSHTNPTVEKPRRIILDVDPGIDDALAMLLAFQSPELCIEALTTVHGNVPLDVGTENALRIAALAGREDLIVAKGAKSPLLRTPVTAELIHGAKGMGTTSLPATQKKVDSRHAVDVIIDIVERNPGEITLVPVGPLTNIALAFLKEPDLPGKVSEIILMGGAFATGNVTPVAEANIHNDAEAAKIVFNSGVPITMVGLDVTHTTLLTQKQIDALAKGNTRISTFAAKVSQYYLDVTKRFFNGEGVALHDPLAVAIAIDKAIATDMRPMYVQVETKGELTYGQTVVNRTLTTESTKRVDGRESITSFGSVPANAEVPVTVDDQRMLKMFMARLLAKPR